MNIICYFNLALQIINITLYFIMSQPLLTGSQSLTSNVSKKENKSTLLSEKSPITKYNIVVDCYHFPCNIIDNCQLQKLPQSSIYEQIFKMFIKMRYKILFCFLCILPFFNVVPLFISAYFAYHYHSCLNIVQRNSETVPDPFKKMTFDPQLCYTMGCDYYLFSIELKQLDGFSLNYQQNVSDRINLKIERGKTNFMIYNATFWASYSYFQRWKLQHYLPFVISLIAVIVITTLFIVLLL